MSRARRLEPSSWVTPAPPLPVRAAHEAIGEEVAAFCANPGCRAEFRLNVSADEGQPYCSEMCRHDARRDYERTFLRLAHFEGVVAQLRHDLAAFGLSPQPPRHRAANA